MPGVAEAASGLLGIVPAVLGNNTNGFSCWSQGIVRLAVAAADSLAQAWPPCSRQARAIAILAAGQQGAGASSSDSSSSSGGSGGGGGGGGGGSGSGGSGARGMDWGSQFHSSTLYFIGAVGRISSIQSKYHIPELNFEGLMRFRNSRRTEYARAPFTATPDYVVGLGFSRVYGRAIQLDLAILLLRWAFLSPAFLNGSIPQMCSTTCQVLNFIEF